MKDLAYYYCSLDTFLNILREEQIYLSDPLKMNDEAEIKYYLRQMIDNIDGYDPFFDSSDCKKLIHLMQTEGQQSIYICCFSRNRDILSQWKSYADDGMGVCIGFDLHELCRALKPGPEESFDIQSVDYTSNVYLDDVSYISNLVIEAEEIIEEQEQSDDIMEQKIMLHKIISLLAGYKSPAFEEEKEVRLIYKDEWFLKQDNMNEEGTLKVEKLPHDFRITKSGFVTEYVKLNISPKKLKTNVIKSVGIGPKCKLNKNDILRIVKHYMGEDSNPDVFISKASYR